MDYVNLFVNTVIDSYIRVYGVQKWDSLTAKEQHDVIMSLAYSIDNALKEVK